MALSAGVYSTRVGRSGARQALADCSVWAAHHHGRLCELARVPGRFRPGHAPRDCRGGRAPSPYTPSSARPGWSAPPCADHPTPSPAVGSCAQLSVGYGWHRRPTSHSGSQRARPVIEGIGRDVVGAVPWAGSDPITPRTARAGSASPGPLPRLTLRATGATEGTALRSAFGPSRHPPNSGLAADRVWGHRPHQVHSTSYPRLSVCGVVARTRARHERRPPSQRPSLFPTDG